MVGQEMPVLRFVVYLERPFTGRGQAKLNLQH